MNKNISKQGNTMRLDKWLWCARFFKTRGQAANAIKTGKITVNDERSKPSKIIKPNDKVNIRRGPYHFIITISDLAHTRKSPDKAILLYHESQDSIKKRELLSSQFKIDATLYPRTKGRPSKRNRRELIKFKEIT